MTYFDYSTSDSSVAVVNDEKVLLLLLVKELQQLQLVLNGIDAIGSLIIESLGDFALTSFSTSYPQNVISIFSDAYDNVNIDFYNGYWEPYQTTTSADFDIMVIIFWYTKILILLGINSQIQLLMLQK